MPGVRRDASALAAKTMQVAQGMLGLEAGEVTGRVFGGAGAEGMRTAGAGDAGGKARRQVS